MNDAKKTNDDLKKELPPELYRVACEKGTEPAFTGKYVNEKRQGMYKCAVCGNELFSSGTKYDSKSGWPSFYEPARESAVSTSSDDSHGMRRTEVVCSKCGSHLGHVFPDGPEPTGQRYCINSVSLELEPESEDESRS